MFSSIPKSMYFVSPLSVKRRTGEGCSESFANVGLNFRETSGAREMGITAVHLETSDGVFHSNAFGLAYQFSFEGEVLWKLKEYHAGSSSGAWRY